MNTRFVKIALCVLVIIFFIICFVGCQKQFDTEDYIRLHIRADSNTESAQNVKLLVRDEVVAYLTLKANNVHCRNEMIALIEQEITNIENIANGVLAKNGFDYKCHATLTRDDFPTRTYGNLTLPEGNYLALILELGSAQGNNWWCVAYPPLCFVAAEDVEGDQVKYKSIIAEFFKNLSEKK